MRIVILYAIRREELLSLRRFQTLNQVYFRWAGEQTRVLDTSRVLQEWAGGRAGGLFRSALLF